MVFHVYNPYDNKTVSEFYVSTIVSAIINIGNEAVSVASLQNCSRDIGVITVSVTDAIEARKKGYYPVILWVQGIIPEESYMRHHSGLRRKILSVIEKKGLVAADILFFISESMRKHFSQKYKFDAKQYYIMPCFNTEFKRDSYYFNDKYKSNQFGYAGGLQAWQCFEQSIELYSLVEKRVPSCSLRVLTKDIQTAERIIKKHNIERYSVGFVPQSIIDEELAKSKSGFALREESIVNYVSTPTKLSSYISNGVFPIYTNAIGDFSVLANQNPYCVCVDLDNKYDSAEKIVSLCNKEIGANDVFDSFTNSFGEYYSRDYHILKICNWLSNFL